MTERKEFLHWGMAGVIVGVFSAIIAFLIAYNLMIVQVSDQKDEINRLATESSAKLSEFNKEIDEKIAQLRGSKPEALVRYEELIAVIEEIRQAKVYHQQLQPLPKSSAGLQKLYEFLGVGDFKKPADRQKLFSLAVQQENRDLSKKASEVFARTMTQKDWLALVDIVLAGGGPLDSYDINREALPCNDESRRLAVIKVRKRITELYRLLSGEGRLDLDTNLGLVFARSLITLLSDPAVCWDEKDLSGFIALADEHGDTESVEEFNAALADIREYKRIND